jgi:hypothetical protein
MGHAEPENEARIGLPDLEAELTFSTEKWKVKQFDQCLDLPQIEAALHRNEAQRVFVHTL